MGIGGCIVLIVVGAILTFASDWELERDAFVDREEGVQDGFHGEGVRGQFAGRVGGPVVRRRVQQVQDRGGDARRAGVDRVAGAARTSALDRAPGTVNRSVRPSAPIRSRTAPRSPSTNSRRATRTVRRLGASPASRRCAGLRPSVALAADHTAGRLLCSTGRMPAFRLGSE